MLYLKKEKKKSTHLYKSLLRSKSVIYIKISGVECHFAHSLGRNIIFSKYFVKKVRHRLICVIDKSRG